MEIRQLRTFVEVAANGSYARTSAIAGIAQSALSRQMSALERGIGGRLFHRTGRGRARWSPTPPPGRTTPAMNARSRTARSRWAWCRWPRAG
jgi:regulatory helix-turn-helix LysR family protein